MSGQRGCENLCGWLIRRFSRVFHVFWIANTLFRQFRFMPCVFPFLSITYNGLCLLSRAVAQPRCNLAHPSYNIIYSVSAYRKFRKIQKKLLLLEIVITLGFCEFITIMTWFADANKKFFLHVLQAMLWGELHSGARSYLMKIWAGHEFLWVCLRLFSISPCLWAKERGLQARWDWK